jgi:hypothetical protein
MLLPWVHAAVTLGLLLVMATISDIMVRDR